MDVDVIVCNHAETAENKLFVTGGGVNMAFVAPQPPHVISLGLGAVIHVPYQATNQAHTFKVALMDEDGNAVVPFHAEGPEPSQIEFEAPFNVGRPPMIAVGDEQTISVAVNFKNLPLAQPGLYSFVVSINGHEARRLPFRIMTPPPGVIIPGLTPGT
ncbi:MAG TPA: hypothetical protein VMU64_06330 [Acidimicrobiales bacterium]|nr:hypothetical protein [Acidimicrobiales bacterium]